MNMTTEIKKAMGQSFKDAANEAGGVLKLAAKTGICKSTLYAVIRGQAYPKEVTIKRVMDYLKSLRNAEHHQAAAAEPALAAIQVLPVVREILNSTKDRVVDIRLSDTFARITITGSVK